VKWSSGELDHYCTSAGRISACSLIACVVDIVVQVIGNKWQCNRKRLSDEGEDLCRW
jgi:hypothetical protein